ncbi:MAG: DUF4276 family protein [Planctomycetota bacterium]
MSRLVFFLEEPSAEALLESYLPRLMPGWKKDVDFVTIVFRGKQDLEKQLPKRLRAWQTPGDRFLVLRDQDAQDCLAVKQSLSRAVLDTLAPRNPTPAHAVRLACRELEAWYWGNPDAVESALGVTGVVDSAGRARFRIVDEVQNPAEALVKATGGAYQKIAGSRSIGRHLTLDPSDSRSASFKVFVSAVRRLTQNRTKRDH